MTRARTPLAAAGLALAAVTLVGCGSDTSSDPAPPGALSAAQQRVTDIDDALEVWSGATTLTEAQRGAEAVSNLVTGPGVANYGDADGDGTVGGEAAAGLLPGESGEASLGLPLEACAGVDLLGGSWSEPQERWADLATKVAAWTPADNPFPLLASHAQRVVGWARLTLAASSVDDALEYSGHARLHVDAVAAALDECA